VFGIAILQGADAGGGLLQEEESAGLDFEQESR
jgi:hypothetical protein